MQSATPQTHPPDSDNTPQGKRPPGRARQRHIARQTRQRALREKKLPAVSLPEISDVGLTGYSQTLKNSLANAQQWIGSLADGRVSGGQIVLIALILVVLVAVFVVLGLYASSNVLPGVSVSGISVGGLSQTDAAARLRESWAQQRIVLTEGERSWEVPPADLGLRIDVNASAERAVQYGRGQGGISMMLSAMLSGVDLEPVIEIDVAAARNGLIKYAEDIDVAPKNATLELLGSAVTHVSAQSGYRLNVQELLVALSIDPGKIVADASIDLPMEEVSPAVTNAMPLVEFAQDMLDYPLVLEVYDPVVDETYRFEVEPTEWGQWLTTQLNYHWTGPRLYLSLSKDPLQKFLEESGDSLPEPLRLDVDRSITMVRDAVSHGSVNAWIPARYQPTVYTVSRGETAYSISRTEGIPFYMIEAANPDRDLEMLFDGDVINLPSRDSMLPLTPVRGKRIIVDLDEQYLRAYENGQVVYEWPISSGISSAPTSTGVFQILSHDELAYGSSFTLCDEDTCGQWVMHWFMGIYEAVPGLMNGFHGAVELPNGAYLGGGQVGRPYTFGCIMAVEENAINLYNWAEEGVVVEIR